jgi:hypothetical protein
VTSTEEKERKMLKEVKVLCVDPIGQAPSMEDCQEAVNIAVEHDCFVKMKWFFRHSGWYNRMIDPSMNATDIYDSLPKVYGV